MNYLEQLNTQQKKAVLGVIKTFAEPEETYGHWDDPAFVNEMNKRLAEYESGKAKTYSWEEVKEKTRKKK